MGIRISKDHLHPSVIESITSLIGDLNQLETTAKGNAVEAINELLANGGNKEELEALIAEIAEGKEIIANAVGEPLTVEESFDEMSNDINGLLSQFKTNMMNNGIVVESGDKFKSLIDKIANLSNNENNSIQYAEGSATQVKITTIQSDGIHVDVDFVPTLVFIEFRNRTTPLHPESSYNTGEGFIGILAIHATDDGVPWCINFGAQMYAGTYSSYHYNVFFNKGLTDGSLITIEKLDLSSSSWIYGSPAVDYTWYAIGIKGDILLLDKGNEYNKLTTGGSWVAGGIELIEGTGLVVTPDTTKYKISTFRNRIDLSKYSSFEFTVNCPSGTNGIWVIADTVVRGGTYAEPVADTATEIAKFENNPTEKTFKVDLTGVNDLAYFGLAFMPSSNSETYQVTNMKLITNDGSSENTALRDSLASILENKGVDVTEEDDMASLITKVEGLTEIPGFIKQGCWMTAPIATNPNKDYNMSTMVAIGNNIHVMGGHAGGYGMYTTGTNNHYAYNVKTDTWIERAKLPAERQRTVSIAVDDGIYNTGGVNNNYYGQKTTYYYDSISNSWTTKAAMPDFKKNHAFTSFDNKLFITGGSDSADEYGDKTFIYDILTDTWTQKEDYPENSDVHHALTIDSDRILVFTGGRYGNYYIPSTDTWTSVTYSTGTGNERSRMVFSSKTSKAYFANSDNMVSMNFSNINQPTVEVISICKLNNDFGDVVEVDGNIYHMYGYEDYNTMIIGIL